MTKAMQHNKQALQPKTERARAIVREIFPAIQKAVPEHINANRMARVFLTEIQRNPKLLECTPESLMGSLMLAAQLGLEPGVLGLAHLVPYKNYITKKLECQFIYGYRGMAHLAHNSGAVHDITAKVVYENDEFDYEYGTNERIYHKPTDQKKGKLKYCYAIAKLENGVTHFDVMDRKDIEVIRKKSKAKSGPWHDEDEPEMWKKSVIKRITKQLPLSIGIRKQLAQDETTKYFSKDVLDIMDEPDQTDWKEETDTKELESKAKQKAQEVKIKLENAKPEDIEKFESRVQRAFEDRKDFNHWLKGATNGKWLDLPSLISVAQLDDLNNRLDNYIRDTGPAVPVEQLNLKRQ